MWGQPPRLSGRDDFLSRQRSLHREVAIPAENEAIEMTDSYYRRNGF
jgi:hypothetical protein